MKKELFAVLLLILILSLSLWNTHCLENLTGDIGRLVSEIGPCAEHGDWAKAEQLADSAVSMWQKCDSYTHIVLRHSDIDSISNDFFELKSHIYERESGAVKGSIEMVSTHLESISSIEKLRLGSIF